MPPFDWKSLLDLPWLSWSIGGLVALTGFILLYRALFSDRPRGRRRCPKCWYDMRGTPSLRCPECGHTAKVERHLHRTRRHWRWASFAALCFIGGTILAIVPQVRRDGWMSLVPTTVLLVLMTPGPDGLGVFPNTTVVDAELNRRDVGSSLSPWQWAYVAREKCFRFRTRWPKSFLPITAECFLPPALGGSINVGEATTGSDSNRYRFVDDFPYIRISPYAIGAEDVALSCAIRQPPKWWIPPTAGVTFGRMDGELRWHGMVRLPIRMVESMDEAMRPLRGPKCDAQIRTAVRVCFVRGGISSPFVSACGGTPPAEIVGVHIARDLMPELKDLALGFSISIYKRAKGTQWFDGRESTHRIGRQIADFAAWTKQLTIQPESWAVLKSDTIDKLRWESDWYVVLRGDPELALRDWDKTAYWDGQITLTPDEVWIEGRDPVEEVQTPRLAKSP